jgi:hypothetical protein
MWGRSPGSVDRQEPPHAYPGDIRQPLWVLLSAATLFVVCLGALASEFAALAGVDTLVGIPHSMLISIPAVLVLLILLGGTGRGRVRPHRHRGAPELMAHPQVHAVLKALAKPSEPTASS